MTLTHQQVEAVKHGDPIRISSPEVGAECVLVRTDVYDQVRTVFDENLSMDQVGALVEQNMCEDDVHAPLLDSYQKYRR